MPLNYFGTTDKGNVKEFNEDNFNGFIHKNVLFLIIADGLGGKEGLVYASAIAINEIKRYIEKDLENSNPEHLKKILSNALYWANRVVFAYKRANDLYSGFGTTITICAINEKKDIVIGHAGNSRLYFLRNKELFQMTKDHTEAQKLFEQGKLKKEEIRIHPERGTLTKAIGAYEEMDSDIFGGKLATGDIVFLSTDGIHNLLTDDEMRDIILESGNSEAACEWLVKGAVQRGGVDNIAAITSYINF